MFHLIASFACTSLCALHVFVCIICVSLQFMYFFILYIYIYGIFLTMQAYIGIHQPKHIDEADLARKRLIFDEFFYLQVIVFRTLLLMIT